MKVQFSGGGPKPFKTQKAQDGEGNPSYRTHLPTDPNLRFLRQNACCIRWVSIRAEQQALVSATDPGQGQRKVLNSLLSAEPALTWISLLILGTIIPARISHQGCFPPPVQRHLKEGSSSQYHSVQSLIRGVSEWPPHIHTHTQQQYSHDGRASRGWGEWFMRLAALGDYLCSISADN